PVDRETFAGECNAWRQQLLPGHLGVAAMRLFHTGDDAGHRDRSRAVQVAVVLHPRPWKQIGSRTVAGERIVFGADAARRAHAVVDHLIAVLVGAIEHHGAAATEAAHPWLEHAEREGGGNRRIDAVATVGQYPR